MVEQSSVDPQTPASPQDFSNESGNSRILKEMEEQFLALYENQKKTLNEKLEEEHVVKAES